MAADSRAKQVAIIALPEVGVSTVYGMYDMFMSAGRDWGLIVEGRPGEPVIRPRVVAASRAPFAAGNGITIQPDATFDEVDRPDLVCVPELLVPPGEPQTRSGRSTSSKVASG